MPTIRVFIRNFSGFTKIIVDGDHHPPREICADGHSTITADLHFMPDHIWFWIDQQEGGAYKANIEIKWEDRNLTLLRVLCPDGIKGDTAKVANANFSGMIDPLPTQVRDESLGRRKTNPIYHVDDFA